MNICPECVNGKHANCDGSAWNDEEDRLTSCQCRRHYANRKVSDTKRTDVILDALDPYYIIKGPGSFTTTDERYVLARAILFTDERYVLARAILAALDGVA